VHDECVEVVGEAFGDGGVGDDVLLVGRARQTVKAATC
jgi:hypothetical protein